MYIHLWNHSTHQRTPCFLFRYSNFYYWNILRQHFANCIANWMQNPLCRLSSISIVKTLFYFDYNVTLSGITVIFLRDMRNMDGIMNSQNLRWSLDKMDNLRDQSLPEQRLVKGFVIQIVIAIKWAEIERESGILMTGTCYNETETIWSYVFYITNGIILTLWFVCQLSNVDE